MNYTINAPSRASDAAAFFDGSRLTLARKLAGWRKSNLASAIGMSPAAVGSWEIGDKRPSPAAIAQLALTLQVDPSFFSARPSPIASAKSVPHFRSLRSTTQIARDQADAYGLLAVDVASALETRVEFPDVNVPAFPVDESDLDGNGPESAARLVRREWDLPTGAIRNMIRLLENNGVLVVFSPEQAASVDAYSFTTAVRPAIVLNPVKQDYYRQRFDAAHELGHLVMHGDSEPGGRIVEEQANRFASEFLVPEVEIRDELPTILNAAAWRTFGRLKEEWRVSLQSLLFRARQLGRLSDVSYRNAMMTVSAKGWRRAEPGLISTVETPSLLPRAVELLTADGISERALVNECGVPADLFHVMTSRTPEITPAPSQESGTGLPAGRSTRAQVISLLHRRDPDDGPTAP
ncbi:XRE family transcriptional regulator [Arthrobacter sp. PsM3]|uniref:XRE family transcriptional regulator n=1 Tax=Arthrobacter sp. PsM3 TaxID=3030531 RepID=UPI00263B7334|nr:XRE family transcriptional regulator [Arthrobacter sp. PsM3]MDN4643425.1 XRE family transcriptional regulator [Arthrobacter sp. PsM3]